MKYYVYVYRHPLTKVPFYVGKGCGTRIFHHLGESYESTENKKKYAVIENLRRLDLRPLVGRFAKNLTEEEAYALEDVLIQRWGRRDIDEGGVLTNICLHQRPPSAYGRTMSVEARARLSESRKGTGNPMYGRTASEVTKAALRTKFTGADNPFFGKTHTVEVRQSISARNKVVHTGRKRPEETGAKISEALKGKTINQTVRDKISKALTGQKQSQATKDRRASKQVGRPRESKVYVWTVTDPFGQAHVTRTLAGFCREKGIPTESLRHVENTGKYWDGWSVTKVKT